jgi:hypothetical protein
MSDRPTSPTDAFAAWLDATTAGMSTPAPGTDADLDALQAAATRFHGLDSAASHHALATRSRTRPWEDIMQNTASSPSSPIAIPLATQPKSPTRPIIAVQAWASYALVAIVVTGLTLGIGRATDFFQMSTPPPVEETTIPFNSLTDDDGTPVPTGESSSYPIPNELNCTVEPLTRDEIVAHYEAANTATEPTYELYDRPIMPTTEDARGIIDTYQMWQACSVFETTLPLAHALALVTPWYTAQSGHVAAGREVWGVQTLNNDQIQELADIALSNGGYVPDATPSAGQLAIWEATEAARPEFTVVPLPEDATPYSRPFAQDVQAIFASEIKIVGPNSAEANVITVNATTGEVYGAADVVTLRFLKVDGVWLIDEVVDRSERG